MTDPAAPSPTKVDPETLAIRGRPPRPIRFKRRVIIAIAAIGSLSLITVTGIALRQRLFQPTDAPQELSQPNTQGAAAVLGRAPATYGDVPRLGPPLPGDLGKPILEHQQATMAPIDPADQQREQAAFAERQQQLAELKAARQSTLLVQGRQAAAATEPASAVPSIAPASTDGDRVTLEPERDPNAQGRKAAFVGAVDRKDDINPHALAEQTSPYTLSAGSVIAASLITGIRSDLPGLVTAQVTENTYDSATGQILLVPQGARLIGTYDSVIAFGQKRALIVWQRIIMPGGRSLRIENETATDPSGYSGLADKVDVHTWQLLKGVALSTVLGVSTELALSGQSDIVQALRMSRQDNVARAGDQITQRNLGVQPTITIRPGAPVRLVVRRDLVLPPPNPENGNG